MIKNFSDYLVEEQREVFFTFGRMNPPTIGHGKVLDTLASKSGKNDYKVYVSQTQDAKKNPLSYSDKVKGIRKMFPKHARNVMVDKNVKTAINAMVALYDQGYKRVTMVVGSDRVTEFQTLLNKYNGEKARHGFYNFERISVISAGERDPDADGVEGMSASKQRENASNNDFVAFSQGVPKSMSNSDARKLFNDVRKGMGLQEMTEFRNHLELKPVSETREKFVQGELFSVGDEVVIKESDEVGVISTLGANYVIVETAEGKKLRKWLDAVELIENKEAKQDGDPCWKGYEMIGMKKKGGKEVPNCVKKEESVKSFKEMYDEIDETTMQDIKYALAKTFQKGKYDKLARYVAQQAKKDGNKKSIEYYAQKAIDLVGASMDARALAKIVRGMK